MNCSTSLSNKSMISSSSQGKSRFIWRFPSSKFAHLPSCSSIDHSPMNIEEELIQRQELALLIYDLGLELNVSFTCIYTAVIYMHRFFMVHSFQRCFKELVAIACLFLSCKVNDMPRLLSSFNRYLHYLIQSHSYHHQSHLSPSSSLLTTNEQTLTSEILVNYHQQIIDYENILLSTLGFCLQVDQPYLIITKTSKSLSISLDVAQQAYDIVTKCILLTYFPMKYTTNLIACFALYLALTSANIHVPDNCDGSQWFHLLNEEFTESILQELANEYQSIMIRESSKKFQQRFEQIRREKETNHGPSQVKTNHSQMSSLTNVCESDYSSYSLSSINGSSIRTTSSTSSIPSESSLKNGPIHAIHSHSQGSFDVQHQTPTRSSSFNYSQMNYSPVTINGQYSLPTQQPSTNSSTGLVSAAKPIPTLMSSSTSHSYLPRHHSRFATPTLKYPISASSSQLHFHPPYLPISGQHYHPPHPPVSLPNPQPYLAASSMYYPQQQTPLLYHPPTDPSMISNKRHGEPPAPPSKRLRYQIPMQMQQPY